jgi:hypothetical protein
MDLDTLPPRTFLFLSLTWSIIAVSSSVFIAVGWLGFSLRPIADDYGLGASTASGVIAAISYWWQTWSGSITTVFMWVIFVGLPLHYLPWQFASLLPFLLSSFLVSGFLTWVLDQSLGKPGASRSRLTRNSYFFVVATVLWWASWWISTVTTRPDELENPMPRAIAFWQTVNIQYIAVILLVCWLWWGIFRNLDKMTIKFKVLLSVVAGLLVGFSGPVVALSSAIGLVIATVANQSFRGKKDFRRLLPIILGAFFLSMAAVIDNRSPGSTNRSQFLPDPSLREIVVAIIQTPGKASMVFWESISDIGILVSFVTLVALAFGTRGILTRPSIESLRTTGSGLIIFGAVFAVVSSFSEVFAYEAWWHDMSTRTLIWLGTSCLGLALGFQLRRRSSGKNHENVALIIALSGLILAGSSLGQFGFETQRRLSDWNSGGASVSSIADIESEWVNKEWIILNQIRGETVLRVAN